jgi:hypothetical protein
VNGPGAVRPDSPAHVRQRSPMKNSNLYSKISLRCMQPRGATCFGHITATPGNARCAGCTTARIESAVDWWTRPGCCECRRVAAGHGGHGAGTAVRIAGSTGRSEYTQPGTPTSNTDNGACEEYTGLR